MSKTKQILILAITAAAAAACGLIAFNSFSGSSVQANQVRRSGAQKWEYCAITKVYRPDGQIGLREVRDIAVIRYFQIGGAKEETVEFISDNGDTKIIGLGRDMLGGRNVFAKAVAKLGDEGWEMVLMEPAGGHL